MLLGVGRFASARQAEDALLVRGVHFIECGFASINDAPLGSNAFCVGGENIGYAPVLVLQGREELSKCLILFF